MPIDLSSDWQRRPITPEALRAKACRRNHPDHYIVAGSVTANGRVLPVWYCPKCATRVRRLENDEVRARGLPFAAAAEDTELLIVEDNRLNSPPCERCGALGVEWHHWAPRHLFDDADDWPMSALCRPCHERWHAVVTPRMSERKAS